MKWKGTLINYIIEQLKDDSEWGNTIEKILVDISVGIHLAVFNEPFLSLVFSGKKKIESRFSINKISPYERVKKGDIVILKESGGPVTGLFVVGEVRFFKHLDKFLMAKIENEFGEQICTSYDENFWMKREKANYASLIEVSKVKKLLPFKSEKRDRSGWSILRMTPQHSSLFDEKI
jgi:ASC-1-like (ASCH) protein